MAFKATARTHLYFLMCFQCHNMYWRSIIARQTGANKTFTTSTTPKMKNFASTLDAAAAELHVVEHPKTRAMAMKAEYAPIYVVLGLVVVACSIGAHTAKQHLVHSPAVKITKKKRESLPEVDDPDHTVASADKFINKSFLRKIAHIQDNPTTIADTSRPDPFTRPRHAETLKTVGMDPSRH